MTEKLTEKTKRTVKTTTKIAESLWRDVEIYAQVIETALRECIKQSGGSEK